MRVAVPLAIPPIPFGLVVGVAATETDAVGGLAGFLSSVLLFAGASQIAAIGLLGSGAGVVATVATIAFINSRHVMYSASLRDRFRTLPRWFRLLAPYLLVDQVFALSDTQPDDLEPEHRMATYLGSGVVFVGVWWASTALGVAVGNVIPASWRLDFSAALLFLGLLFLAVNAWPGLVAAIVSAGVALLAHDLPSGSGLLLAAVLGIIAGGLIDLATDPLTDDRATEPRADA